MRHTTLSKTQYIKQVLSRSSVSLFPRSSVDIIKTYSQKKVKHIFSGFKYSFLRGLIHALFRS